MPQARIAVQLPEHVWVGKFSKEHPDTVVTVLGGMPREQTGVAIVRVSGADPDAFLRTLDNEPAITDFTVLEEDEAERIIHFETSQHLLLLSARRAGVPIEWPVTISDGEATFDVTGAHEDLSELVETLREMGVPFRIDRVGPVDSGAEILTERQREVLMAAVQRGYYDTPRRCSLTELAEELDVAKSTCSEVLHRAEEVVIKRFVEDIRTEQQVQRRSPVEP